MNVHLDIERIVIEGLSLRGAARGVLRRSLEAEFTRLVRAGGVPVSGREGAVARAPVAPMQLSRPGDPRAVGRQIARAVYGGLRS